MQVSCLGANYGGLDVEKFIPWSTIICENHDFSTGLRSVVGKVSGYRCESDCKSWGREFDPGPVPCFRGVKFDHEIISTVILLPSAESFKKGCCQLQGKVCVRSDITQRCS